MKNNFASRTAAGILAAAMVLTAASCSSKSQKTKPQQTADQVVENSYRAVEMDVGVSFNYVEQFCTLGNSGNIMICGSTDTENVMYIANSELQELRKVDLGIEYPENSDSYFRSYPDTQGNIITMVTVTDYGKNKKPDYSDPDFDYESFDFDAFYAGAKSIYYMVKISSSGDVLSTVELSGYEKYIETENESFGSDLYIDSVIPCADGTVILSIDNNKGSEDFVILNEDGSLGDKVEIGDDIQCYNSCMTSDGKLAFFSWEGDSAVISFIDTEQKKLSDKKITLKDSGLNGASNILPGSDEYAIYISDSKSLYGLREDGTSDELINWIDSDLNGDNIRGIIQLSDGDFAIFEQSYTGESSVGCFYRLTKRDVSELENTIVVTLGLLYTDSSITSKVNEFNKSSDKYRIRISDYSQYDEWDEETDTMTNSASKQLKLDIIAGNAPDMIYTYDISVVQSLASKGVFTDLYSLLGTNGTPGKDQFVSCALTTGECNGKLLSLSPTFSISTMAAKTKHFDHDNWTLSELIETYDNLPDDMKLFADGNDKHTVFERITNGCSSFIDLASNTCSFNSSDFVKVLEFCNRFPDEPDEPDWENATQEEMDKYYEEYVTACRNDKALLGTFGLYDIREYARELHGTFGEDISLVGYPSENGKGGIITLNSSFSILDNAANKDACWDFISQFFTEEYFKDQDTYMIGGLPTLKSSFTSVLDSSIERPYSINENGDKEYYDDTYWVGDTKDPLKIDPLTKEERDYLEDYILNSTASGKYVSDIDIQNIVNEEVDSFFAGERSAQETADSIQNRVSILLSEQG